MATRNSGRNEDRNSRSASTANASSRDAAGGSTSARRDNATQSGGSRQNSGGSSAAAGGGSTGIGGLGASAPNATSSGASSQSRPTTNQSGSSTTSSSASTSPSSSRSDQERQLRTSREQGGTRSSQNPAGQSQTQQQQGRPLATNAYYGNTSPFAMMRRMMDDMDRLFSDFGFVQPGLLASSLFGPDAWSNPESALAIGSGQSGTGQQRSLSGQSGRQQGVQRSNQQSMPSWSQGLWSPEVEVREQGNNIVIRADLPGLSRDDIDLEVDDDSLIIRGERHNDWEDEQEGYYRSERSYGTFYRAIPLPEGVDPNACNATFKDGVLEVTLPKPHEAQSKGKKIQVK